MQDRFTVTVYTLVPVKHRRETLSQKGGPRPPRAIFMSFVRTGVSTMQMFRKTEISDVEFDAFDALAAYLTRNTKANSQLDDGTLSTAAISRGFIHFAAPRITRILNLFQFHAPQQHQEARIGAKGIVHGIGF